MSDSIWKAPITVDALNTLCRNTMVEYLGIEFTEVGPDFLRATMPVDARTVQPAGRLHGGASVALAETLGSAAGICCVDARTHECVGIEINANHVRSARKGVVTGTARPIHIGGSTQVWGTEVRDERGRLVSTGRITLAVIPKGVG